MKAPVSPIYLLADSEMLFWKGDEGFSIPAAIGEQIDTERPSAAYIGASNGDAPEFYSIFEAAMDAAGIAQRRMITSRYTAMDDVCLSSADVILLAGGDVALGWSVLDSTGMRDVIIQRYYAGAVLIGVSAGAVQLGLRGFRGDEPSEADFFETMGLIPFIVDVHDEAAEWQRLKRAVQTAVAGGRGIGIPRGAGLIWHPDHSLQPLRAPSVEITSKDDGLTASLLFPGDVEPNDEGKVR